MQTKLAEQTADAPIPVGAVADMVTQYQHRLLSLEAELHDYARARVINDTEFQSRIKHLHELHADLARLTEWASAQVTGEVAGGDLGLPLMTSCTPAEAQVCALYLKEKSDGLQSQLATMIRLQDWLHGAVMGRVGSLRLTFRLSKLRQLILQAERASNELKIREEALAKQVTSLLHSLKGTRGQDSGVSTLQALKNLFMQLDAATQRVARLTAAIKKEEGRVQAMRAWLAKEGKERELCRPAMDPPTPYALAQAASGVGTGIGLPPMPPRQRRRQELVDDFVHSMRGPRISAFDQQAMHEAAALLVGRKL